jgi:arabinan endo-1,5-alpha-L-arabinosidase
LVLAAAPAGASDGTVTGDITGVHDPSIAKAGDTYYIFSTGPGIPVRTSPDLVNWTLSVRVFQSDLPDWAPSRTPGTQFPWAPDISYFAGAWHLYYAISTFGAKRSAIGVATSPSLDTPEWTDHGVVVGSDLTTTYNAIDPNVFIDEDGSSWLAWGSAYFGLVIAPLDPQTGKLAENAPAVPIAGRTPLREIVEAAFIVRHGGYYYLFVSFDACCRGVDSTYHVRVRRATNVLGPYLDNRGVPMLAGGGRLVIESEGDRRGPGHNAVLHDGDAWWFVFHYYDAANTGVPTLGILPLHWTDDGWPSVV